MAEMEFSFFYFLKEEHYVMESAFRVPPTHLSFNTLNVPNDVASLFGRKYYISKPITTSSAKSGHFYQNGEQCDELFIFNAKASCLYEYEAIKVY